MADAILRLASPKQMTPQRCNVSEDDNPNTSGKKGKSSTGRSKNVKSSDNFEKSKTKPSNSSKTHEANEVTKQSDRPPTKADSSNNTATGNTGDYLTLTLLTEIRNLCSSVGEMKETVQNSVLTVANKIDSLTNMGHDDDYNTYDNSDTEIEASQRPLCSTNIIDPKVKATAIDPTQSLFHDILSSDQDDRNQHDTNNSDAEDEFNVLDSLRNNLSVEENVGDNVEENLATIVTSAFTFNNKPNEIATEKLKKYKRPGNCPALKTQEINKLMWDSINSECRTADLRMQRIQTSVIKASIAITECLNNITENKTKIPKTIMPVLVEKLGDAIALNANAVREIILRRKNMIQPHIKEEFKPLCAPGAPVSYDELLGEDLAKSMKDVSAASKLANKATKRPQYSNSRGYSHPNRYHPYNQYGGYNQSHYRGGFRPRRSQNHFLFKGRTNNKPPEKKGGVKAQ